MRRINQRAFHIALFLEFQHAPKERCFGKQMSLDTDRRSMGWVGAEDMEAERKLSIMGFQE